MPAKDTRYTDIMKAKVDRRFANMKSYFTRENLEAALSEFDNAPEDARFFCKCELPEKLTLDGSLGYS